MEDYDKKVSQMLRGESVLAAEDQKNENIEGVEKDISLEGKKASEAMSGAANSVKNSMRIAKAQKIAKQHAANIARIRSGPVLAGPTRKLPDGRRVCPVKSEHPQGGGELHVDEDCCPDRNEYPNPRCYYTPEQLSHILKPPK